MLPLARAGVVAQSDVVSKSGSGVAEGILEEKKGDKKKDDKKKDDKKKDDKKKDDKKKDDKDFKEPEAPQDNSGSDVGNQTGN
jgi:hypothetical protein